MRRIFLIIALMPLFAPVVPAQSLGPLLGDEEILYAQTKQVNQFFRRFNCEESTDGTRYYQGDKMYRNPELREKYLSILFNEENPHLSPQIKDAFINQVLENNQYLNFHGNDWFAEVKTLFLFHGEEKTLTLFLQLQEEPVGSKWVITNVYFQSFHEQFLRDAPGEMKFLHPLSHELDFMNLIKVFNKDREMVELYTSRDYKPDYLTLFIYELKRAALEFKTVKEVKFHFFQIPGYYFELSDFIRKSYNSGWLISNLIPINKEEKELLMSYIYHE